MAQSEKIYLFGNWKMYLTPKESAALARSLSKTKLSKQVKMAVFPTALAIESVNKILKSTKIATGVQNVYWQEKGGFTGEVSASMSKEIGCKYVLVGHSERRHLFKESNSEVRQKMEAILNAKLTPVLCVGETLAERKEAAAEKVVEEQLRTALNGLNWPAGTELIIAYEPVWSIGTGVACDPAEAERMSALVEQIALRLFGAEARPLILYGGSVQPENAAEFLAQPHLRGVLVGGASANLKSWLGITKNLC